MSDAAEVRALIKLAGEVASWGSSREGWNAYQADLAKRVSAALNSAADALEAAQVPATDDEREYAMQVLLNNVELTPENRNIASHQADDLMREGFRRSSRVPVSRDKLAAFIGSDDEACGRSKFVNAWVGAQIAGGLLGVYDIYPKADRKPADSSNGDDRG